MGDPGEALRPRLLDQEGRLRRGLTSDALTRVRALWAVVAALSCLVAVSLAVDAWRGERAWQPQKASANWIAIRFIPKGGRLAPDAYTLIVGGEGTPAVPPPRPVPGRVAVRNVRPGKLYRISDFR